MSIMLFDWFMFRKFICWVSMVKCMSSPVGASSICVYSVSKSVALCVLVR